MMIHWHEGLHLLPQHLQALQRFVQEQGGQERPFLHRYTSGILDLELSHWTGTNVGIHRLRGNYAQRSPLIVAPTGVCSSQRPFIRHPHRSFSAVDVSAPSCPVGAADLNSKLAVTHVE